MALPVNGRYHLIAHLGGGTTSDVSLAKADGAASGAQVSVIKRLKLGADAEPDAVALFAEEARLAARLKHANIARASEAGEDADGPFLLLEYVEGQSLARIRSRARRRASGIPRAIAVHIVKDLAAGLGYAHALEDEAGKALKIIHRDVTPENVIVGYDGTTKVVDFSAAPAAPATKGGATPLKGGVAYVAPEQVKSAVKIDARVDVFAAGIILWELLAGRRMWEGLSETEVMARLADETPLPAVRTIVPDVPEALDAICSQAIAKVRDDRFDSAVEFQEALAKVAKTPGLTATANEVAEFVTSLFEDERTRMRAVVDEALVRTDPAKGSVPRLGPPNARANEFGEVETDPKLWAAVAPIPAATSSTRIVEVLRVEQAPSPDRRFAIAIGGAVLIAFAIVAIIALTRDSSKDADKPAVVADPRPRPTAPAPEPSASAYVEPEEVTIDISVKPTAAHLFVDGIRTASNPHRVKVVRGTYKHEVRAEAEGFDTRTMTVLFDRDRSIEIALTPKPPPHPVAPPPPPPRPSAAP